ncbi:hypothetical protein LTSESEN_3009 [Salmonella enterica subsp. enterica serovar Senftenberg str. A4-543]|uniref:Uncharacterized protein n=1 Tax=Salmonella enterica subsp. enterica serovar Senftenberg str. A4-543 TaxID=913082 RepID=G5R144_SALSE|nr:hypothetical protein LTSESEN_3009 [Salmonella enterica subsp. enterica serovar Senftenberg str. A4-543]
MQAAMFAFQTAQSLHNAAFQTAQSLHMHNAGFVMVFPANSINQNL